MGQTFAAVRSCVLDYQPKSIICTGDIFHHWNSPPELVNFAIQEFRNLGRTVYSVAGNHDLPEHRFDQLSRSSYATLVAANAIINLYPDIPFCHGGIRMHGFPCGTPIKPLSKKKRNHFWIELAVVHDYCWFGSHTFPGAPLDKHAKEHATKLRGYSAAVFGDNHKGFLSLGYGLPILNVGGFIRRNSDEADYNPTIGLLHADGTFERVEIGVPAKWELNSKVLIDDMERDNNREAEKVASMLKSLKSKDLDYGDALRNYLRRKRVSPSVKKLLLNSIQ